MLIILGSKSPRRAEILRFFSLPFEQKEPPFSEEESSPPEEPKEHVLFLALEKAKSLAESYQDSLIITADTIVFFEGKIFGKPKSEQEAYRTLSILSQQWHTVYTGLTVFAAGQFHSDYETTRVLFNPLTSEHIQKYYQALHCWDKAGGYAVQRSGHIVVKQIEGCFYNVMGLPMNTLRKLLLKAGIDLWDYLTNT